MNNKKKIFWLKAFSTLVAYTFHLLLSLISLPNRKYPEINCVEEREKYKAVFNDQYPEYKDLHRDISTALSKFQELDAKMAQLLKDGKTQEVGWMFNYRSPQTTHINQPQHFYLMHVAETL